MKTTRQRRPVPQIRQFLSDHSEAHAEDVARSAGTTRAYLIQLAGGYRQASAELARDLEKVIPGLLRAHCRPDLYGDLQTVSEPDAQAS